MKRRPKSQQHRAPCGCRVLTNARGEWAMQAPCSPQVWGDFDHQQRAARDVKEGGAR